jgi:predicted RNA-binding Zn ribbon-like protein
MTTRPLTTEPPALDLVDTEWIDGDTCHDLLEDLAATRAWLGDDSAGATVQRHLRATRAAIRAVLDDRNDDGARARLNAILARGHVRETLSADGPAEEIVVDPAWRAAWLAAHDLVLHLRTHPDRLRHCAGDGCILHFLDSSRSGRRQWCSMDVCGNRAKARRHYARARSGG